MFALVILALAAHPFALAVNAWTCGLGTISFSCYITHFTAIRVVAYLMTSEYFTFLSPRFALVGRFVAIWLGSLLLTVPASVLTYWIIEKPGTKLGSRVIRLYEPERPIQRSPA